MSLDALKVGITGGIGSGKTTVSKIFAALSVPVYYADDRAKQLMIEDASIVTRVKELFGPEAYQDGQLQRKYIAEKAFYDKSLLVRLNAIVHPAVRTDYDSWVASQVGALYTLNEAALHFETGGYKRFAKMILISAPEDLRVKRVLNRDSHRSESDVKAIIENQMSEDSKAALADFVIANDGSTSVIKQVLDVHAQLMAL